MLIRFAKEGGLAYIPALAAPVTIDTAALEPEQGQALEKLVEEAGFFELPETVGRVRPGAADYQTYTITVESGDCSHTVRVLDLDQEPAVGALVRALDKQAKQIRRGAPRA